MPQKSVVFPKTHPNFFANLGPSLVAIGLGLGSGEFILWPYLTVNYGYGILWGAVIGISFQILLNLEIQRYASVTGEDFLKGAMKISKFFSLWFIISTLLGFGWPGFAASSGFLLSKLQLLQGLPARMLSYGILLLCGLLLVIGKNAYRRIESLLKVVIPMNFLVILLIFITFFRWSDVPALFSGIFGVGTHYLFIPSGIDLGILLGAFAYAGSGGNLLLGQSFYVIEKGHGLGKFTQKFHQWTNAVLHKKDDDLRYVPSEKRESMENFISLRKFQTLENVLVFGGMGLLTILMLSYLGPVLIDSPDGLHSNISFLVKESGVIGSVMGNFYAQAYLWAGAIALCSVQLGVFDLMGRISSIVVKTQFKQLKLSGFDVYRIAVLVQMFFGFVVFVLGMTEPFWLLRLGAIINAGAMAVIGGVTLVLNNRFLPPSFRPALGTNLLLAIVSLLYGVLFFIVL